MSDIKKVESILRELLNVIKDMDLKQDGLKKEIDGLMKENEKIKKSIVMTREQINRNGRPKSLSEIDIENIRKLRDSGESFRSIAEKYSVSHTTVRNALKSKSF